MRIKSVTIDIFYLIYQAEWPHSNWDMIPMSSILRSVHGVENPARLSPPPRKQSKRIYKQPSPMRQHQPYRVPLIGRYEHSTA